MENQIITISSEIQSGTPVFYNTRVPIKNLFDYISEGKTIDEFQDDFPSVTKKQIQGIIEMVSNLVTFQPVTQGSPSAKTAA